MKRYVNDIEITAYAFGFDGCHKFYLVENEEDQHMLEELGYTIYKIEDLPREWAGSCPLRFIDSADLERVFVHQFTPAEFVGWDIDDALKAELYWLTEEQRRVNE